MSEQTFQHTQDEREKSQFDDPLAELARIVSGEETPTPPSSNIDQRANDLAGQPGDGQLQAPEPVVAAEVPVNPEVPVAPEMAELDSNPFAKYIVEPVKIEEPPVQAESQPVPDVAEIPSGLDQHPTAVEQQTDETFANEFESQLPNLLDADLGQDVPPSPAPVASGEVDLESQLMAELKNEANGVVPEPVVEQQAIPPVVEHNAEPDFEASLEQSLGMDVDQSAEIYANETPDYLAQQNTPVNDDHGLSVQDDALREFNETLASIPVPQEPQAPQVDPFASQNSFEPVQSPAVEHNPVFPEPVFAHQSNIGQQQPSAASLFHAEDELLADENQINASVQALQSDVVDASDIESAFSDAFAEELSLEMQTDQTAPQDNIFQQHALQQQANQQQALQAQAAQVQAAQASVHEQPPQQQPSFEDGLAEVFGQQNAVAQENTDNYNPYLEEESPLLAIEQERIEVEPAAVAPASNGSGFRMAAMALGGAIVIGGGIVAYGMLGNSDTSEPVIVKADKDPIKQRPVDAGGKKIENQDQPVYNTIDGGTKENEQTGLVNTELKPVDLDKSSERIVASQSQENQNPVNNFVQPRRVKVVTVRADGTIVNSDGTQLSDLGEVNNVAALDAANNVAAENSIDGAVKTSQIPIPSLTPLARTNPVANQVSNVVSNLASNQPVDLTNSSNVATNPVNNLANQVQQRVDDAVQKPVEQIQQAVANNPVTNNPVANNVLSSPDVYKVQISSQRSQEAAEASYQNLKRRFAGLLEGQPREIRAVDVDGKGTFYRVQIPVGEMPAAADFCKRYKSAGGSCFVTR